MTASYQEPQRRREEGASLLGASGLRAQQLDVKSTHRLPASTLSPQLSASPHRLDQHDSEPCQLPEHLEPLDSQHLERLDVLDSQHLERLDVLTTRRIFQRRGRGRVLPRTGATVGVSYSAVLRRRVLQLRGAPERHFAALRQKMTDSDGQPTRRAAPFGRPICPPTRAYARTTGRVTSALGGRFRQKGGAEA